VLAVVTGLMTYAVHALMNSFLDSDKIAALWWGFIALITATDLVQKRETGFSEDPSEDRPKGEGGSL